MLEENYIDKSYFINNAMHLIGFYNKTNGLYHVYKTYINGVTVDIKLTHSQLTDLLGDAEEYIPE